MGGGGDVQYSTKQWLEATNSNPNLSMKRRRRRWYCSVAYGSTVAFPCGADCALRTHSFRPEPHQRRRPVPPPLQPGPHPKRVQKKVPYYSCHNHKSLLYLEGTSAARGPQQRGDAKAYRPDSAKPYENKTKHKHTETPPVHTHPVRTVLLRPAFSKICR